MTDARGQLVGEPTIRHFIFYKLADGEIVGRTSVHNCVDVAMQIPQAGPGEGVIEHSAPPDMRYDRVDLATGRIVDDADPEFAAQMQVKFAHITSLHPQLLTAVPPAPIQPQHGTFRFNVAEYWQDLERRAASGEWRLRAPAASMEGLVGPFHGCGSCLNPVFVEGHLDWYDPLLPAQDEDIVLVQWDTREIQGIYERNSSDFAWLQEYPEPNPIATKLLKAFGNEYYLVTNTSMTRLGKNRILGVLRKSLKDGMSWQYEGASPTSNIRPNAATETYQISELAETAYGLGSNYVVDGVFTPDADGVVELTASYDYRGLAQDGLGNAMDRTLFVQQNSAYQYGVVARNGAGNSTWVSQTHSDFFTVARGAPVTFGLLVSNASGTEQMRIRNARMKAGFIKR